MLSKNEKEILTKLLSKCENVQEMFDMLSKAYDFKSCHPGAIAKPIFISGIIKGIDLVNPNAKP